MAKNKVTTVPKPIRNEVKALRKQAKANGIDFVVVYSDGKGTGISAHGTQMFHTFVSQVASQIVKNYGSTLGQLEDAIRRGYEAGQAAK